MFKLLTTLTKPTVRLFTTESAGSRLWKPRKRVTRPTMEKIRDLNASKPEIYGAEELSKEFKMSVEAIRRILRSKYLPDAKDAERQERNRYEAMGERRREFKKNYPEEYQKTSAWTREQQKAEHVSTAPVNDGMWSNNTYLKRNSQGWKKVSGSAQWDQDKKKFIGFEDGERKSFNSDAEGRSFNSSNDGERKFFNRDGDRGSFNRDGDRSFNRDGDRSFNRDGDRSFNRDGDRSFNRDGDRSFNRDGDRRSFNRDGDRRSFNRDGDRRSFNRDDDKRSFSRDGDIKILNSEDFENRDRERRSFNRSEDGERRSFNRGDGYNSDRPPPRLFNRREEGGDGPPRLFNRREGGDFNSDRPRRSFNNDNGDNRPARRSYGNDGGVKPARKFHDRRDNSNNKSFDKPRKEDTK